MTERRRPINTASTLARLLSTEGWTDHLANECDRYIRGERVASARQVERMDEIEEAAKPILGGLSVAERLVVGRFIALHKGMAFEAGLRVGLGTRIHRSRDPDWSLFERRFGPRLIELIKLYHASVGGDSAQPDRATEDAPDAP